MRKRKINTQNGFTLIEVLLAVMILGISITIILQQFSVALRAGTTSQASTFAVLHAKQKLEELKLEDKLTESAQSGTFEDGYTWMTSVIPFEHSQESDDAASYESLRFETFQLESIITWKEGSRNKQVVLTTLKTEKKKQWD